MASWSGCTSCSLARPDHRGIEVRQVPDPAAGDAAVDVHIASFIVHTTPAQVMNVAARVAEMPGAEVHAATPEGKVVVTMEAAGSAPILDTISTIQQLPGVISAALVYQCADSAESMNEEISDADRPQGLH